MKKIGYILICMTGLAAAGCGGGKNEIEPAEVVMRFHEALTSMDFSGADDYCTDGSVWEYISRFEAACQQMAENDREATQAASVLLSKDGIIIEDTVRNKDQRTVFYTISDGQGNSKNKVAVLKKTEEGEWKIEDITDAI